MARSPQQIAEGVLACIPETASEKNILSRRFNAILASKPPVMDIPLHIAPEVVQSEFSRGQIIRICKACEDILGLPAGVDWKQKVVDFVRAGR